MIVYEEYANIFKSGFQTLVNPVNTQGIMGAGLALQFKKHYPGLESAYKAACLRRDFAIQGLYCYDVPHEEKKVLCFPTKRDWRRASKLIWIDNGLARLAETYTRYGITSLGIPAIGCGLGDLVWKDVYKLIIEHLEPIDLPVGIFLPRYEKVSYIP